MLDAIALILEAFLNIWCSRTNGGKQFGRNVKFTDKLTEATKLGLPEEYCIIIKAFNTIRNSYAHERKYSLDEAALEDLKERVNLLPSRPPMQPCEKWQLFSQGRDRYGRPHQETLDWESSDMKKRILLIFVQLVLKLVQWMQTEFSKREIPYAIILWPNEPA